MIADRFKPRLNILDIGGGKGEYAITLGSILGSCWVNNIDKKENCYIGNVPLPFKNEVYDFIFAGNMIDILPNPDNLLKEIHRIMTNDGVALLTFPSLDWWANKIAIILGYQPYGDRPSRDYNVGKLFIKPDKFYETNEGYFHYFSRRAFKQLAQIYGFKVKFHTLPWQRFSIVSLEKR
jgi:ubiquinone/menaquinone biosynthesis C-methylase UbiE